MLAVGEQVHRITGVTLADGRAVEVTIEDGIVSTVDPAGSSGLARAGDLHLPEWLLLSAATEPHAHLDKAFSWAHVDQVYGDLRAAIASWHDFAATVSGEDVYARARLALDRYLAHGITTVRTHIDVLPGDDPLRGVEAVLRLRDEVYGVLDLQVTLLARYDCPAPLMAEAIRLGVDVLGGCPHLADDPAGETIRLLDLAEQFGIPLDLHTDEQLGADVLSIRELSRQVRSRGLAQRVTASHCVSLGSLEPHLLAEVVEEIRLAGIGIVSLPITNLYLQGRDHPTLRPRGITALRALLDADVDVAAGGDNLRDPFNPMGRADPFETTSLLVTAGHLDADEALAAVTRGGRRVLGLPPSGPTVGAAANFVALTAPSLADALAGPGDTRVVVHRGRLVSQTTVHRQTALQQQTALQPQSALFGRSA
jgi:cytosine deaminase